MTAPRQADLASVSGAGWPLTVPDVMSDTPEWIDAVGS